MAEGTRGDNGQVRIADLSRTPDARELRLQQDDCVVSIWLPAGARPMSAAMRALTAAGFTVVQKR